MKKYKLVNWPTLQHNAKLYCDGATSRKEIYSPDLFLFMTPFVLVLSPWSILAGPPSTYGGGTFSSEENLLWQHWSLPA